MTTITVRNVPEPVRDELAARARRTGRSLQEFLHAELVALAEKPDVASVVARARRRVEATGSTLDVEDILALRDTDRR